MRTTFSLAPFATPLLLAVLHACGGDPGAPGAPEDPSASSDAPPAEAAASDTPRAPSDVEKGPSSGAPTIADDGATHVPWRGGNLIALREDTEPSVPRFSIAGSDEAPPDFSSIADWKEQPNYPYSSPQYATLPSGELFVFDAAIDEAHRDYADGVFRWSPDRGASFEKLPVPSTYGAFQPTAIVANATDDVWVGAAIKREPFGDDFPGCAIIVFHSLDDTYLAHWDGQTWSQLATPRGMGRLRTLTEHDGTLTVETGWGGNRPPYLDDDVPADATWERAPNGAWSKLQ